MGMAAEMWVERVRAHHQQSERVQQQSGWTPGPGGRYVSSMFTADPRREDDPILQRLRPDLTPSTTVLDIGGGAGRHALPLALACRQVTVVEPDPGMVSALRAQMARYGIANIAIVEEQWQQARLEPADVVLCAHMIYDVVAIEEFLPWLTAHARRRVWLLAHLTWPIDLFSPFWPPVHQEPRVTLPAIPELLPVLWETGLYPDLEMLAVHAPEVAPDRDAALAILRQMIYVRPGSAEDARLLAAFERLADDTSGGVVLRQAPANREALVSWPGQAVTGLPAGN
jgi:SAM-dependent methyltransferase